MCPKSVEEGGCSRYGQVARKHSASCLALGSNGGWLKSTRKPRGFFGSCVENYGEFDRSENIFEHPKIKIYLSIYFFKDQKSFYIIDSMMEILFLPRFPSAKDDDS